MSETGKAEPDAAERVAALQRIGEKSRRVVELWLGQGRGGGGLPVSQDLANDFLALGAAAAGQPDGHGRDPGRSSGRTT